MQVNREGQGWRIAVDLGRPFPALIGGDGWACELQIDELKALCHGVSMLVEQYRAITPQLMVEESITIHHQVPGLWMELVGSTESWCLRFLLEPEQGRACEGAWSATASQALVQALEGLELGHIQPLSRSL